MHSLYILIKISLIFYSRVREMNKNNGMMVMTLRSYFRQIKNIWRVVKVQCQIKTNQLINYQRVTVI